MIFGGFSILNWHQIRPFISSLGIRSCSSTPPYPTQALPNLSKRGGFSAGFSRKITTGREKKRWDLKGARHFWTQRGFFHDSDECSFFWKVFGYDSYLYICGPRYEDIFDIMDKTY